MKLMGYNSQMETTIDSLRSAAVLLVGFFARARASVLAIVVASATAVGLAACGGGGDVRDPRDGGGLNPTAYFHGAARVEGLQYKYEDGGSGETDARGRFSIEQGKTVVFLVGEATTLGTVVFSSDAERDFVTPSRIVGNSGDQALRVERLLIALDDDSHLDNGIDNGIKIPVAAMTSTTNLLAIMELELSSVGIASVNVDGLTLNIPTTEQAMRELMDTNNCAYSGSFAGLLSDTSTVALVLMPSIGRFSVTNVVTVTNASPMVSFINDDGTVKVGGTVLAIDLKTPPLTATLDVEFVDDGVTMTTTGTITLASYDRIEFGGGTVFGTLRRVAGDPDADYRLAGIYYGGSNSNSNSGNDEGAFVADIYSGESAQISDIRDPNFQNTALVIRMGEFPTSTTLTTALTLGVGGNSATLTLSADPAKTFSGASNNGDEQFYEGSWCEL